MHDFFKDFASPIVTLIAAITAGGITWFFSRTQARIGASQPDIAMDKLKFDLFRNRYEIYEAAKSLIEYVSFVTDLEKSDSAKIRSLYVKIDEARFYFPPDIRDTLDKAHQICERFLTHLRERELLNIDNRQEWSRLAEVLSTDQSALRSIYASLPKTFETALAFKQLTKPL
jgi:hypothetical protein